MSECERQGLRSPTLVRFSGILRNRVRRLRDAFNDVIKDLEYQGAYIPVVPIKVNQQRRVVEEVISVNERVRGRLPGSLLLRQASGVGRHHSRDLCARVRFTLCKAQNALSQPIANSLSLARPQVTTTALRCSVPG
jgi:hypothetical protein